MGHICFVPFIQERKKRTVTFIVLYFFPSIISVFTCHIGFKKQNKKKQSRRQKENVFNPTFAPTVHILTSGASLDGGFGTLASTCKNPSRPLVQ